MNLNYDGTARKQTRTINYVDLTIFPRDELEVLFEGAPDFKEGLTGDDQTEQIPGLRPKGKRLLSRDQI